MDLKETVRFLTEGLEDRKEIFEIAYCRGRKRGKKIEAWINTELLARLLLLKERGEFKDVEGEHTYHIPKTKVAKTRFEHCDLWWKSDEGEQWLEIKTLRFHSNSDGLKDKYKRRIKKDLAKMNQLKPPYHFNHLLILFDDADYHNGDWKSDLYSVYQDEGMKKVDKWHFNLDEGRRINFFLHNIEKRN